MSGCAALTEEVDSRGTAIRHIGESSVVVVMMTQLSRQQLVDVLRKTGFWKAADEAMRVLPDPVDLDYACGWAEQYGITRDHLISRMGGSP
jgi:hypothetical protein